jgi:hypothetical protein
MSAALVIDILLWGSVAAVGFIALQRGRLVLTTSVREGAMDFINIVPRIALGVIGSGYIAAVIPQEIIIGWLGPNSGWFGVLTAAIAGAATPGGPVVGFSIGAVAFEGRRRHAPGDRLCGRVGAVRLPAAAAVGNPLHAGAVCLVPGGGVAAVPVFGRSHRHGDRQALKRHQRRRAGARTHNLEASVDVSFGTHYGLKSDIARGPKSANKRLMHRSKFGEFRPVMLLDRARASISWRNNAKSIGLVSNPVAPWAIACRLVSSSP